MTKALKPIETREQIVFIVHGTRRIVETTAMILVCGKMSWAEVRKPHYAKRYLLGTSAFFTRKAAEVRKLGVLRKLAACTLPDWHVAGQIAGRAQHQLNQYAKDGIIH